MHTNATRTGNPAFKQGLLFGILMGLFSIVLNVILSLAGLSTLFLGAIRHPNTDSGHLIGIGEFLVAILACLLAGKRASQQTGKVGTGALAGLWTWLIGAVITWGYSLVFYATSPTPGLQVSVIVLSAMLDIALTTLLFGVGIGALGGLLRKR